MKKFLVLGGFAAALSLLGAIGCGGDSEGSNDDSPSGGSGSGTGGAGTGGSASGGSASGGGASGGSSSMTITDYYIAFAEGSCRLQFDCCTAEERPDVLGETVEDCVSLRSAFSALGSALVNESIVKGRVEVDLGVLEGCAAVYQNAACGDPYPIECTEEAVYKPLVALGEACGNDYECIEGHCTGNAFGGEDGVCELELLLEDGEACTDDLECASEACHYLDDVCFTPAAVGAPCRAGSECASGRCDIAGAGECLPEEPEEPTCSGFTLPEAPTP